MAWDVISDVNDGQDLGGSWIDEVREAVAQIQEALGPDVPAWTAYTPVLGGSGWSLGTTGAIAFGVYVDEGDTIRFHARLIFGSLGATFSANVPTVSLPPFAAQEPVGGLPQRTSVDVELVDTSTATSYRGCGDLAGGSNVPLMCFPSAAAHLTYSYVVNGTPFSFAAGDEIRVSGWYRKA